MRIAARFDRLGHEAAPIRGAHEVLAGRGDFFRQLGKDSEQPVAEGVQALRRRYWLG